MIFHLIHPPQFMKCFLSILPIALLLFPFHAKGQKTETEMQSVAGIILKNDNAVFDFKTFLADLTTSGKIKAEASSVSENMLEFQVGEFKVLVADFPTAPCSEQNLYASIGISWLWKTAEKEIPKHQSHLGITILGKPGQALAMHKLFTNLTVSALQNSNSCGVYMPNQYLLVSKGHYLESARNMSESDLPIYLWVYFGLSQLDGKAGGYTYGLKEFGLKEMEVVRSSRPIQEVHAFLFDKTMEVILGDRKLKAGEKVSAGEGQNIEVRESEGEFLEGITLKLLF